MAWWGKFVGGALGFMLGGPIGAMLGATMGHNFDSAARRQGGRQGALGQQERTQAAFFAATFSVMGHIAKADGQVSESEIGLVRQLMAQMQLNQQQKAAARRLFEQGKSPSFQPEAVLQQLRQECHRRTTLLRMFVEIQVQAAFVDGRLAPAELRILHSIAATLGFTADDLEQIIGRIEGVEAGAADRPTLEQAYKILGVSAATSTDDIRRAYRKLRSRHHPDKLVSKGLPEEMIKLANEKTHEIQTAWQQIQHARSDGG